MIRFLLHIKLWLNIDVSRVEITNRASVLTLEWVRFVVVTIRTNFDAFWIQSQSEIFW